MKKREVFKVGVNWQVVIPPEIRESLDLHRGDYVRFAMEHGRVVLKKVVFREADAQ